MFLFVLFNVTNAVTVKWVAIYVALLVNETYAQAQVDGAGAVVGCSFYVLARDRKFAVVWKRCQAAVLDSFRRDKFIRKKD